MNMNAVLKGNIFELRTYYPEDVSKDYVKWINDSAVNQFLEARVKKYSFEDEQKYVKDILNSNDELLMAIIASDKQSVIGSVHLTVNKMHKRCFIAYMIGDISYWGKGIATQAIKLSTKWAFDNLDIARMDGGVYTENVGSEKAVLKAGYKIEGRREDFILLDDGRRCDEIVVGLTRTQFGQLDYAK